jgi:hypothetical protein
MPPLIFIWEDAETVPLATVKLADRSLRRILRVLDKTANTITVKSLGSLEVKRALLFS